MPIGNYGRPVSGLEAFMSGATESFGGVTDFLRKRQEQQMADKDRQRKIQNDVWDQDRKNIEAGIGPAGGGGQVAQQGSPSGGFDEDGGSAGGHWAPLQQGVRSDPVTAARQQVGGIRAAIGGILSRFNAPADGEVTHLTKTGPSSREVELGITESGANARNERTVNATIQDSQARIAQSAASDAARLAEDRRNHDFEHSDRQAGIAVQGQNAHRQQRTLESQGEREYAKTLDQEMDAIRRETSDKGVIAQFAGQGKDGMAKYYEWVTKQRGRLDKLHEEREDLLGRQKTTPPKTVDPRAVGRILSHGGGNSF